MSETALVTGGAKRIGQAIVRALAREGWDIVVWQGSVVDPDFYRRDFSREAVLAVYPELGNVS
jgi:NAD(P)-dependent dehydrogenase (short-subunit alcohol dehydrogenase family)